MRVDPSMREGREPARRDGALLLGAGAVLEILGTALLVWQEQNVYTVSQAVTLPAWGGMLVGIALVQRGYSRRLRSASLSGEVPLAVAGLAAGAVALTASLTWQLAVGLVPSGNLDLEVYAALAVFFVGVAALTTATRALVRRGDLRTGATAGGSVPTDLSRRMLLTPPAALLCAGVALLASAALYSSWLGQQAADVNSLYQFVALELCAGGAWLLLSGASSLLALVPAALTLAARRIGAVGGAAFLVAGAVTWWRTASLAYALSEILLGGFVLAGLGLLLASWTRGASSTRDGRNRTDPTRSALSPSDARSDT